MIFQPIKPKKISSQIAEQIRSSILSGEYKPGDRLPSERELTEMFCVSRPTVHEAINILAATGLVKSSQGERSVVKSLVETSSVNPLSEMIRAELWRALDVIEVRKGVESWTAFYAAQRALPEDLRRMEVIVARMEQNLDELQSSEDLDANLHIVIARATHNIVWLHLMQNLFDATKAFMLRVWHGSKLASDEHRLLHQQHRAIIAAIKARDADAAREAMLTHLTFAEQRSTAYVTLKSHEDVSAAREG